MRAKKPIMIVDTHTHAAQLFSGIHNRWPLRSGASNTLGLEMLGENVPLGILNLLSVGCLHCSMIYAILLDEKMMCKCVLRGSYDIIEHG